MQVQKCINQHRLRGFLRNQRLLRSGSTAPSGKTVSTFGNENCFPYHALWLLFKTQRVVIILGTDIQPLGQQPDFRRFSQPAWLPPGKNREKKPELAKAPIPEVQDSPETGAEREWGCPLHPRSARPFHWFHIPVCPLHSTLPPFCLEVPHPLTLAQNQWRTAQNGLQYFRQSRDSSDESESCAAGICASP